MTTPNPQVINDYAYVSVIAERGLALIEGKSPSSGELQRAYAEQFDRLNPNVIDAIDAKRDSIKQALFRNESGFGEEVETFLRSLGVNPQAVEIRCTVCGAWIQPWNADYSGYGTEGGRFLPTWCKDCARDLAIDSMYNTYFFKFKRSLRSRRGSIGQRRSNNRYVPERDLVEANRVRTRYVGEIDYGGS